MASITLQTSRTDYYRRLAAILACLPFAVAVFLEVDFMFYIGFSIEKSDRVLNQGVKQRPVMLERACFLVVDSSGSPIRVRFLDHCHPQIPR